VPRSETVARDKVGVKLAGDGRVAEQEAPPSIERYAVQTGFCLCCHNQSLVDGSTVGQLDVRHTRLYYARRWRPRSYGVPMPPGTSTASSSQRSTCSRSIPAPV